METTTFEGTREQYMTEAVNWLLDNLILPETDLPKPPFRITIGWPKGSRAGGKILGTCHPRSHSTDGHNEIFISPTIGDTLTALEVATHEAIHAVDDCEHGHKKPFGVIARAIGLEGPLTHTVAGPQLREALQEYINQHGLMPFASMNDSMRKKQSTRLLLIECDTCEFKARISNKWALQLRHDAQCLCCDTGTIAATQSV